MAKTKTTIPTFDYTNETNHLMLTNMFLKVKSNITLDEAINAHKTLFSDPTKPVTEEDITNYFNNL
jgi:hypothetical protein